MAFHALHKVLEYFAIAESEGLHCLSGAQQLPGPGWFVAPTLYADVPENSRLWREEIFGPVLCSRRFSDEADALRHDDADTAGPGRGRAHPRRGLLEEVGDVEVVARVVEDDGARLLHRTLRRLRRHGNLSAVARGRLLRGDGGGKRTGLAVHQDVAPVVAVLHQSDITASRIGSAKAVLRCAIDGLTGYSSLVKYPQSSQKTLQQQPFT